MKIVGIVTTRQNQKKNRQTVMVHVMVTVLELMIVHVMVVVHEMIVVHVTMTIMLKMVYMHIPKRHIASFVCLLRKECNIYL